MMSKLLKCGSIRMRAAETGLRPLSVFAMAMLLIASTLLTPMRPAQAATGIFATVFHASPDLPAVDVYLNDQKVAQALAFDAFGESAIVSPGRYTVKVFAAGAEPSGTPLLSTRVALLARHTYVLALANVAARLQVVLISNPPQAPRGYAKAGIVNLDFASPPLDLLTDRNRLLVSRVGYRATRFVNLRAGTVGFKLRVSRTRQVVLEIPPEPLESGGYYVVWLLPPAAEPATTGLRTPRYVVRRDWPGQ